MKFVHPDIGFCIDTETHKVQTLVIENPILLYELLGDIQKQIQGQDGRSVVSENNKVLAINKSVELLTQFVPFDLNHRSLLGKLNVELEKCALSGEYYTRTMELISELETYFMDLAFELSGDICFNRIIIGSIVKSMGAQFREEYDSLAEKIIDYMELVTEYEHSKLFILFNLRCYISDKEAQNFMETILQHNYHVLMIEAFEHRLLDQEQRIIIDNDLCEIRC